MIEQLRRWLQPRTWFAGRPDVLSRSFFVIICVRAVLAGYTVIYNQWELSAHATSQAGLVVINLVIIAWSVIISWLLRHPKGRTIWPPIADLVVVVAIMVVSPLVVPLEHAPVTLAGYWMAGPGLYASVLLSTRYGMLAALSVSVVFVVLNAQQPDRDWHVVMVLLLATAALGELMGQFKATIAEQERERTRSAALSERERLARIVHDGALQVLALVEREAPSLGPRGVRLATMARESESQLRTLLRDREIVDETVTPLVDLAAALDKFQSARVTVSTMAGLVMVPRHIVTEVEATLVEALKNVEKHAGEGAEAWVLLEQETDDEVILWVRDNGKGLDARQVQEAAERGRMGIKDSIVGRMESIGGSAMLRSAPGSGAEWELRFPTEGVEQ